MNFSTVLLLIALLFLIAMEVYDDVVDRDADAGSIESLVIQVKGDSVAEAFLSEFMLENPIPTARQVEDLKDQLNKIHLIQIAAKASGKSVNQIKEELQTETAEQQKRIPRLLRLFGLCCVGTLFLFLTVSGLMRSSKKWLMPKDGESNK